MILPLQTFQPLNHANLKCLKKSSQIPGDWHLKPGEYMSNKTKKAKYFYLSWYFLPCKWSLLYSLVALLAEKRRFCFTLQVDRTAGGKVRAFPQTLLNLHFTGIRFELISDFPSKLDWYNSSIMKTLFLNCATPTGIVRQLIFMIFRFTTTFGSYIVRLWVESNCESWKVCLLPSCEGCHPSWHS